jgi:hypothetical protein
MTINVTELVAEQLADGDFVLELNDPRRGGWLEINIAVEAVDTPVGDGQVDLTWDDGLTGRYSKDQRFRIRSRGCTRSA